MKLDVTWVEHVEKMFLMECHPLQDAELHFNPNLVHRGFKFLKSDAWFETGKLLVLFNELESEVVRLIGAFN